jgi:pimeloyl-ACP methyl ester carboxylesterase/DNA-binding CsgD family transcriptional regulator
MHDVGQNIRFCRSADGTRIAYSTSGSGPCLVWVQHWIHHLELDVQNPIWRTWLGWLSRRYTLVRFDWRGCGLSDHAAAFSVDALVQDLEAVIAAAGAPRCGLFGMAGSGSGIAMAYAAKHPENVACLILQEPHTRGRLARQPAPEQMAEADARLKVIELGWANDTPAYRDFFTALHIPDASPAYARAYNDLVRQTTNVTNAMSLLRTFWKADFSDVAARISCASLIVHARGDSVIPFEEGRRLAGLIPQARFVPLESKNHLLLDTELAWPGYTDLVDVFLSEWLPATNTWLSDLTAREREVLRLLARGFDNASIASELRIAEKTVRNHVSALFGKLEVNSRAEAVAKARDAGIGANRSA